jgi:glycosyltransferase involved in cell wall biosynthesis
MNAVNQSPKQKISVLFVVPTLQGGGAERVILTILRHLDQSRCQASLVIVDGSDRKFNADLPVGLEIIDLQCPRVRFSATRLVSLIRKRRPDIVFSVLGHLNLMLALLKPLFPRRTKLIVRETIVVSSNLASSRWAWVWRLAYRRLLPRCDAIVCQSHDMRQDLINDIGIRGGNIALLPNPVDIARVRELSATPIDDAPWQKFVGSSAKIRLVAAGRLVWQKGFDILIKALAVLADPRLHLTIIGTGPLRTELIRLSKDLKVDSQIDFAGFVANPYPLYRSADAFILSSRFEGMPNVVLEALACGTGVIAIPSPGGINEILQDRAGCKIANATDSSSLADAIASYDFRRDSRTQEFDLEDYAVERVCNRYMDLFMSVADRQT